MRRLVGCALATTVFVGWVAPASAVPSSPRPTAALLSTGALAWPSTGLKPSKADLGRPVLYGDVSGGLA